MSLALQTAPQSSASPSPDTPPDEARLVRATLSGDSSAFDDIIRLHSRRVFNFIHQMTRQRQDAEDIVQQTFIKAFNHIDRFDTSRPLINWLLTIARRTALNHFRSSKKWEEVPADAACTSPSPARTVEIRDQADNLWARARRLLTQREFEVLWLRFAEELSIEDTSSVTGLTETNIKVIVHRARLQLLKSGKTS